MTTHSSIPYLPLLYKLHTRGAYDAYKKANSSDSIIKAIVHGMVQCREVVRDGGGEDEEEAAEVKQEDEDMLVFREMVEEDDDDAKPLVLDEDVGYCRW